MVVTLISLDWSQSLWKLLHFIWKTPNFLEFMNIVNIYFGLYELLIAIDVKIHLFKFCFQFFEFPKDFINFIHSIILLFKHCSLMCYFLIHLFEFILNVLLLLHLEFVCTDISLLDLILQPVISFPA